MPTTSGMPLSAKCICHCVYQVIFLINLSNDKYLLFILSDKCNRIIKKAIESNFIIITLILNVKVQEY